ncbi:MAG: NAD-dependent epimerase/dehydratase family protein [Candidatus Diapherotrites archaeon]|nr:NAD-dependent epimerase/dehydratase family protein [Candidatus Diapherotrites archaeon]
MNLLVTGSAGFIGFHLCKKLLLEGHKIVGVDNYSDYYEVSLKKARNAILTKNENFSEVIIDINDYEKLDKIFKENKFDKVINLAAIAGVRHSLEDPFIYEKINGMGFLNILECCRHNNVKDLVYASSSSVYGGNDKVPASEEDTVDSPISLYAATKKYNELLAHTYSHLFGLNCTGLRFFTVYGPYGRPDMALFLFAKAIVAKEPINVFNNGKMERDFTYVDDIVNGITLAIKNPFKNEVFNLGRGETVQLTHFIELIEKELGKQTTRNMMPMQPGDVSKSLADVSKAKKMLGYEPKVSVEEGIRNSIKWYKEYYHV